METKICKWCGRKFATHTKQRRYCSEECYKASVSMKSREYHAARRKRKKERKAAIGNGIDAVGREARRKGTTYGKLMAQKYIDEYARVEVVE